VSEDTTGVTNTAAAVQSSSPEPQTVPKYRLDEELAQKRLLQEQLLLAQQMLRQSAPNPRPQVVEQDPDWLKTLKDENPNAYKAFKMQDRKLKEQSAATFQVMDQQDRQAFLMEFGQEAGQKLQEVETKLEELRRSGVHHFNRGQIYLHLEGVDAVKSKRAPKASSKHETQSFPTAVAAAQEIEAPSSDPKSAGILRGSSAPQKKTESLDDLEKRLENEIF
jgi:hypothetical protein